MLFASREQSAAAVSEVERIQNAIAAVQDKLQPIEQRWMQLQEELETDA